MKKGIRISVAYYFIGVFLSWVSYRTIGYEYVHAPGLHHFILFFTFVGAFLWFIAVTYLYFRDERTPVLKGIILTHLVVILGAVGYLSYLINEYDRDDDPREELQNTVSVTVSGDTTIMYHGMNIVYIKVKDSVMFNSIDSSDIDWSNIEYK